jgi:hypothetical protein
MRPRAQIAIEFLTTYGFMMLIVGIVLVTILFISGINQTVIPSQCFIYGTMKCGDMIVTVNGAGSTLKLRAFMAVPGIVNVSSFNAIYQGTQSSSGYCTESGSPPSSSNPTAASQGTAFFGGQLPLSLLCEATFPSEVISAQTYSGKFIITANYCPLLTLVPVCKQASTYRFTGGW